MDYFIGIATDFLDATKISTYSLSITHFYVIKTALLVTCFQVMSSCFKGNGFILKQNLNITLEIKFGVKLNLEKMLIYHITHLHIIFS